MPISDKLLNSIIKRFEKFDNLDNPKKPAVFLFTGATFDGLSIRSFDENSYDYIQKNLRILSGLYGILNHLILFNLTDWKWERILPN